jgi:error-prone DNA polymerase
LEDETGIANVVVMPDIFDAQRLAIIGHPWVLVEGRMQNVDGVTHVRAESVSPLGNPLEIGAHSHDFH